MMIGKKRSFVQNEMRNITKRGGRGKYIGSSFSSSVCFYKDDLPSSEAPSATTCDLEVVKTAVFIFVHTF